MNLCFAVFLCYTAGKLIYCFTNLLLYCLTAMNVISLVTQKGGSGKTTLALNFAVTALSRKGRVVVLDMDAQGTAKKWYERRTDESPQLVEVAASDLEKAVSVGLIQSRESKGVIIKLKASSIRAS